MREEYISRINKVIDYIEANIDEEFSLAKLADVACFSRFHFHRIFTAMMNETPNQFIQRIRITKAADRLVGNPKESVTEIAFSCGYSGSAVFSRAFRDAFGMTPSEWRSGGCANSNIRKEDSNSGKQMSKSGQDFDISVSYPGSGSQNQTWRITMKAQENFKANVEVKDMPDIHVAYLRHIGPYKGDTELFARLFTKLFAWAGARGLIKFPETRVMSIYHDNPETTDENKLRTDVCISVSEDTVVDGEFGKSTIKGGKHAVGHFEISVEEYEKAWSSMLAGWLPDSGYQPDDGPCYEHYLNDPKQHPEYKHIVDIYIPVKPL